MIPASATAPSSGRTGGRTPTTSVPYKIIATGSTKDSIAHTREGLFPFVSIASSPSYRLSETETHGFRPKESMISV